jgi:hypothetical protein
MSNSIHAATDKAVFDALCQYKIAKDEVLELFFSRGVIVSKKTDKEELAKRFSSLFLSYSDYDKVSMILGVSSRKERLTSYEVQTKLSIEDVENYISKIKKGIQDLGGVVSHTVDTNQKIQLNVTYQILNLSKSEFQQTTTKDAEIIIEKSEIGLSIRSPQNHKMEEINNIIIDILEDFDADLYREDIELSSIVSPRIRSSFFEKITEEMEGLSLRSVTDVFVYNPKNSLSDNKEKEVHITSASFKGRGVNLSEQLNSLHSQGFYIWKIIWQAKVISSKKSDLYVFEAQFSEPENCKVFSYMVKGSFKRKDTGIIDDDGEYTKNRTPVSRSDENRLNGVIEKSARNILKTILECKDEDVCDDDYTKQVDVA